MGIGRHFGLSSNKNSKPKKERDFRKISWLRCECSCSSQIPSQDNLNNYHQYLSLYKVMRNNNRTELIIYDTENDKKEVKILDTEVVLDETTCITQLPNGDIFCYGNPNYGVTVIIDTNYRVRMLPSTTDGRWSSALYFDNSIYCFGAQGDGAIVLSRKFDLEKNRWINLAKLPNVDMYCQSVIFNGNILIAGFKSNNLWLYSIEINSFSIIPYYFKEYMTKIIINIGRMYLIEWDHDRFIYESEDAYDWKLISKIKHIYVCYQTYCLYNKGKIFFSTFNGYYKFDLKKKKIVEFEV